MRNYYLLVGPSGIGKSTWLKQTTEKLTSDGTSFYVASRDEIVHEVAKENGLTYSEMFLVPTEFAPEKTVLVFENGQRVFELQHKLQSEVDSKFAKRLFEKLKDESVTNTYIDMTNLSRKTRKDHIKRFLGLNEPTWKVQAVSFLTNEQIATDELKAKVLDVLVERCSKRTEQPISKEVLEKQLSRFTEPNIETETYLSEVVKVEVNLAMGEKV